MLQCIFNFIAERIKNKWDEEITRLQAVYPDAVQNVEHLFCKNDNGRTYVVRDYWNLPIVEVSSVTKSPLESEGYSCYVGMDGKTGNVILYNDLGQSSQGCTKYLASLAGMVPCVMYVAVGGVDEMADHASLRALL